jgi:hypothetical protein
MADGEYTAKFGEELTKELEPYSDFQVYYDHGDSSKPNVGNITPYLRDKPYNNSTTLANVDILITHKTNNIEKAVILIEIEETKSAPKTILGDIFNLLLAGSVCFSRNKDLKLDFPLDKTYLIVGAVDGHDDKLRKIGYIFNEIKDLKKQITGSVFDISIGRIELLGYRDLPELLSRIKEIVLQDISEKRQLL